MVVACLILMCVIAAFSFGETIQRLITGKMEQTPPKKEASGKVKKGSGSKSNQSNRKQRRAQNSDSGSFHDPYADTSSRSQRVATLRTRAVRKVAHKEPTLVHDPNKAGDNGKESDPPDGKVEGNDPPPDSAENTETTSDPNK